MILSTEVKTHVIITHSGGNYFITNQQNERLREVGMEDYFETENNQIKGSSIAEIMTVEKYYETYPDKKSNNYGQPPSFNAQTPDFKDFRSSEFSRNGLASMIRGLKRSIAEMRVEGREPLKALELLADAEKSYDEKYPPF